MGAHTGSLAVHSAARRQHSRLTGRLRQANRFHKQNGARAAAAACGVRKGQPEGLEAQDKRSEDGAGTQTSTMMMDGWWGWQMRESMRSAVATALQELSFDFADPCWRREARTGSAAAACRVACSAIRRRPNSEALSPMLSQEGGGEREGRRALIHGGVRRRPLPHGGAGGPLAAAPRACMCR